MRWLHEFFTPGLKCERVGHKPLVEWRRGYVLPDSRSWGIVDRVRHERCKCTRCGFVISPWAQVGHAPPIHGYSAPSTVWDKIESGEGYWYERGSEK